MNNIINMHFIYNMKTNIIIMRGDNMLISLVGLTGSGKSTIARLLCSYNKHIIHLDIDKIAHLVLTNKDVKSKLYNAFGPTILYENNKINRKSLGQIVFNSPEKMEILATITWPYMEDIIDKYIANNQNKIIILDYLLLPKTKYFNQSDLRILVKASEETRLNRIMKRDNITEEQFYLRNSNSPELNEGEYDYVINTDESLSVEERTGEIYAKSIIHRKF